MSHSFQIGQQEADFDAVVHREVNWRCIVYLPEGYDGKRPWPLMLFLHGAGERGTDLNRVKIHGPLKRVDAGESFPFIIVAPQCPLDRWWDIEGLTVLLDRVEATYAIDPDRIYVTGLSMGGYGTWGLAAVQPHRFAAIAPICGGGEPRSTRDYPHLPTWVFHGARDQVVRLDRSQQMVDALKAAGGNPRFTIYPDAAHDAWSETYSNPEFYDWLLAQKRQH